MSNGFWKRRAGQTATQLFSTPKQLIDAACEYFEWCEENPLIVVDHMSTKFGIEEVRKPKARVFTYDGLCNYLGVSTMFFTQFRKERAALAKTDPAQQPMAEACEWIAQVIQQQKFEGAAAGIFNSNIIARDLGLVDRQETEVKETKIKVSIRKTQAEEE